jgi:hypothetical protein
MTTGELAAEFRRTGYLEGPSIVLRFEGGDASLVVLRRSAIEAVVREAGMPMPDIGGWLKGPFQLHLEKKDLYAEAEALKKIPGIWETWTSGQVIYVDADRVAWDAVKYALGEVKIADLSWVVNLDQGRIGIE